MGSKVVAAVALALLVLGAAEGQVLPTPCCRIDCCDGKPECCSAGPWMAVDAVARPPAAVAVAATNAKARRPGAARKVGGGN
ncbi:hypothetical protein U9M48_023013 [Paspalum notatum var. saurae]|uniref:Uncharacterized protein n=1 Tax=Paspalum notatum var. saurae TaxID=547442 RepID=A0AAQ3TPG0_PASNO